MLSRSLRRHLVVLLVALALTGSALPSSAAVPLPGTAPFTSDNVTHLGTVPLDHPGVGGEVVVRDDLLLRHRRVRAGHLRHHRPGAAAAGQPAGVPPQPERGPEGLRGRHPGGHRRRRVPAVLSPTACPPVCTWSTSTTSPARSSRPPPPAPSPPPSPDPRGSAPDSPPTAFLRAHRRLRRRRLHGHLRQQRPDLRRHRARHDHLHRRHVERRPRRRRRHADIGGRHALNRDASGLLISDSHPRLVLATTPEHHPDADPFNPVVLAEGTRSAPDDLLQHNNLRSAPRSGPRGAPTAPRWRASTPKEVELTDSRSISVVDDRPVMRPASC
jgi:hypothetical protein